MDSDRSHRRRPVRFMQRKDNTAAYNSEKQKKGGDVIDLVGRAGEYQREQDHATGKRQTRVRETQNRRAFALTQAEGYEVYADRHGWDQKENCDEQQIHRNRKSRLS